MTLRRRLTLQIAAMLAGVALLGAAGVAGVASLRADLDVALRANEQLRHAFTVGAQVAAARSLVERSPTSASDAADALGRAADVMETFAADPAGRAAWVDDSAATARAASVAIRDAAAELRAAPRADALAPFARPYARLADLVAATRAAVSNRQAAADAKQRWTIVALASLAAVVMAALVTVGAMLYRGVLRPLAAVRGAARRIAGGDFATRAPARGDAEFSALAADFNAMAGDLQTLYGDLERRIAEAGRRLAQNERLASVGFLAAGVAHEINNPLGIIAGHGERALLRLRRTSDPAAAAAIADSLRIICDEAFRCKRITDGLLTLGRPDEGDAADVAPLRLDALAADVVATLTAMPAFADRRASVRAEAGADCRVVAHAGRLRQVVVNLVTNALEATDPAAGRVRVALCRPGGDGHVVLEVADDGVGMSESTLAHAFEPFFSEKRGDRADERAGVGLGLSVAHAIVTDLGGTLHARSDGPGRGSTFTLRLPAAVPAELARGGR